MDTIRLYRNDVYLKEWTARVTSAEALDRDPQDAPQAFRVTLDRTAFFPEGGGQSCDTGHIDRFRVTDVQEDGSDIIHTVEAGSEDDPDAVCESLLSSGEILCSIDWERRFTNMQRHCGEHILSGSFYRLFGAHNMGFHMGHDYMTIDMSTEGTGCDMITDDMAKKAQLDANEVIWKDVPVVTDFFENRQEASAMPLRKPLAFDEDISIVTIGPSEDTPYDCVACCGTHPSTSGQVGLIKIYKTEKYKGMTRIYFDAGKNALMDYDMKDDILTELSGRFSSSAEDIPARVSKREEKINSLKAQLYAVKKNLMESEREKLERLMEKSSEKTVIYRTSALSANDLADLARSITGLSGGKLLMLYSVSDTTYILSSDGSIDCGSLVKEYASFYNGKGGGKPSSARAIFTSEGDADLFADLIDKHLRG